MQCCHLSADGHPCAMPAVEGSDFCFDHLPAPLDEERAQLPPFFRLIRWAGAVFLLSLVLLQIIVTMREIYRP